MKELGKIHQLIIPFFGHNITINLEVILMTWIVFAVIIAKQVFGGIGYNPFNPALVGRVALLISFPVARFHA